VLDELVLEAALRAAATWDPAQVVSVNMDGQTLADPLAGDRVLALLARTGVAPERLALEVPEASLVDGDAEVLRTLRMLRGHGVRMSVDGFSVGYSVFVRLRDLQPDIVKVDSRVEPDTGDPGSQLTGITRLAHSFGSLVIAERIETEDQLTAATIAGCDAVQGYLLGAPGRTIDRSTEHEAVI
jgi:diguanylate cyclase